MQWTAQDSSVELAHILSPSEREFKRPLPTLARPGARVDLATATCGDKMSKAGENVLTGWPALLLAGLLEIVWAIGLKYSDGLTRFWPGA